MPFLRSADCRGRGDEAKAKEQASTPVGRQDYGDGYGWSMGDTEHFVKVRDAGSGLLVGVI